MLSWSAYMLTRVCPAKNTVRPGLQEALLEVKKHKGALVVYSLSRLSRSTRDTLELADRLEKVGADLVVLQEKVDTTTPSGSHGVSHVGSNE